MPHVGNALQHQRPIGFSPEQISALVNEGIVSQHAEEAAFLWTLRERAVGEPHYTLRDLAALDERVDAHLAGISVAGDVGWRMASANLQHRGPGEVFAASVLAFDAGDVDRMRVVLDAGCTTMRTQRGLVSALGWLEYDRIARWAGMLLQARSPVHRRLGIAAYGVHGVDPGPALARAVDAEDPALCARVLRSVGTIKRHDLFPALRHHLKDKDESCRFWAAWSAVLLGGRDDETLRVLSKFVEDGTTFSERALHACLRVMSPTQSRSWIRMLSTAPRLERLVVMAVGILGDPIPVPWLIEKMERREVARLAGEAVTMITGVDLAYHDLVRDSPATADDDQSIDEVLALDSESNLPWPAPSRVARWWSEHRNEFGGGTRYLAGKPLTRPHLIEILSNGTQRQRAAAALELAISDRDCPLFEVRARGAWQKRKLAAWTS